MGKSSIKTQIGVNLPNDVYEVVLRRAEVRGLSVSRFSSMIFEWWKAQGYPAIDTVDSTARAMVMQDMLHAQIDPSLNEPLPGADSANRIHAAEKRRKMAK